MTSPRCLMSSTKRVRPPAGSSGESTIQAALRGEFGGRRPGSFWAPSPWPLPMSEKATSREGSNRKAGDLALGCVPKERQFTVYFRGEGGASSSRILEMQLADL